MAGDRTMRVLLCAFLVALTVLTVLACMLTWRTVRIAGHVEQAVAQTSRDVQALSHSVAEMGKALEQMVDRLARMEEHAEQATGLDDAERALEVLAELRKEKHADPQQLSPEAEAEVEYLLARIRSADAEFIGGDDRRSPTHFAVHLWSKYRYFRKALSGADEFIEKVATRTISGYPYRVVFKDGTSVALDSWLRQQLMERRATGTNRPTPENEAHPGQGEEGKHAPGN